MEVQERTTKSVLRKHGKFEVKFCTIILLNAFSKGWTC